ncbi:NUDIX domain-containing protein 5 [Elsinoe fawcettii]|nr:NUDIX domain-containing protein 5 [Elsinoe fawcettii]
MSHLSSGLFGAQNIYDPYFTTNPVTRLSFLRQSNTLLHKASQNPSAKYLCLQNFNPLRTSQGSLQYLPYDAVRSIIGEPYAQSEADETKNFNSTNKKPILIFLGLDLEAKAKGVELESYSGVPYFALDVSRQDEGTISSLTSSGSAFTPTRVELGFSYEQSSIYAQARSFIDWNQRNAYCSSCGGATLSVHGGAKIICPPADNGVKRGSCPTRIGLHNTAFPRTDPTLIAAPVSADGKRVLLGRGKRWPPNYFSALSGFVEPAESLESATRREVYEESGVKVGDVQIHSSQAWPYPSTLLVGTIGQCRDAADEKITYPEKELDEARWFEFDEVKEALDHGHAMWEDPPKGYTGIRVPGNKLMAHRTLRGVLKLFARR